MDALFVGDFAVVPGGDIVGAQLFRLFQKRPEFDLPIAQDVGVGGAPRFVFGEKMGKHPLHIFLGEIHRVIGDVELCAHSAHVGVILFGGAVSARVLLFPIQHIQPDDVSALSFQQQRGDRTVHAAAHAHDYPFRHVLFSVLPGIALSFPVFSDRRSHYSIPRAKRQAICGFMPGKREERKGEPPPGNFSESLAKCGKMCYNGCNKGAHSVGGGVQ